VLELSQATEAMTEGQYNLVADQARYDLVRGRITPEEYYTVVHRMPRLKCKSCGGEHAHFDEESN